MAKPRKIGCDEPIVPGKASSGMKPAFLSIRVKKVD